MQQELRIVCVKCGSEDFTFIIFDGEANGCLSCDGCGAEDEVVEVPTCRIRQEGISTRIDAQAQSGSEGSPVTRALAESLENSKMAAAVRVLASTNAERQRAYRERKRKAKSE